ncbi:MAG: lysoplasmalogenase [Chloroflexi bacterium]|jgi:uncharacterized membrane protein YhhN|nr:lysoplasmalogenase [Chloroflexota bacterium]
MMVTSLSLLILVSALWTIQAKYRGLERHEYVAKPLTTILILLLAVTRDGAGDPFYQAAIVVGLGFSLAGDVFLMLPGDRFVPGLASFLLAHLAYIVAFTSGGMGLSLVSLAPFLPLMAVMYGVLAPHLGEMKVPVLLYEVVIIAMAWRAWARWAQTDDTAALLGAIGAVLFVASDAALAVNRFVGRFKAVHALVLGTYFCAQWLIALSI